MTQMSAKPSELVILLNLKNILWPLLILSPILVFIFVKRFSINAIAHSLDPAEIFFGAWIVLGVLYYFVDFIRGGKSRRYVVIGEKGIFVSRVTPRWVPWRQIEDCTCETSNERRIMKISIQRGPQAEAPSAAFSVAHAFGAAKWPAAQSGHFDIDFARTEAPQRSLDLAMQSCRAWLATKRDPERSPAGT